MVGDETDDIGGSGVPLLREQRRERISDGLQSRGLTGEGAVDDHPVEVPLQLPDVLPHAPRDEEHDIVGEVDALCVRLLADNRTLGFEVGRLNVSDQPPHEAGAQALLEALDGRW